MSPRWLHQSFSPSAIRRKRGPKNILNAPRAFSEPWVGPKISYVGFEIIFFPLTYNVKSTNCSAANVFVYLHVIETATAFYTQV